MIYFDMSSTKHLYTRLFADTCIQNHKSIKLNEEVMKIGYVRQFCPS